jgi:hypothetical protein
MMQLAQRLDVLEKQILSGKRAGLLGGIQIGGALNQINEGNLWLETDAKSFVKYVQDTHGFGRSSAYNLMGIAKTFGKHILADPSLQSIEPTRLVRLLPFVDESNQLDLLHEAATVPSAQAFDDNLRNRKGKVATDECGHPVWEPWLEICPKCRKTRKYTP